MIHLRIPNNTHLFYPNNCFYKKLTFKEVSRSWVWVTLTYIHRTYEAKAWGLVTDQG